MPIRYDVLEVPLGGLETKLAKEVVQPGQMLDVQNANFDRPGSLTKRPGLDALAAVSQAGTQVFASAKTLYVNNAPIADGHKANVRPYMRGVGMQDAATDTGSYLPLQAYTKKIANALSRQTNSHVLTLDSAIVNGVVYVGVARRDVTGAVFIYGAAYDYESGEALLPETAFISCGAWTNLARPVRLVTSRDGRVFLIGQNGVSTLTVFEFSRSGNTITWGATNIVTDALSDVRWDVCSFDATQYAIAYRNTSNLVGIKLLTGGTVDYSTSYAAADLADAALRDPSSSISVSETSTVSSTFYLGVAWTSINTAATAYYLQYASFDDTLATISVTTSSTNWSATQIFVTMCDADAQDTGDGQLNQLFVYDSGVATVYTQRITNLGSLVGILGFFKARGIASKPVTTNDATGYRGTYIMVYGQQFTYYLHRVSKRSAISTLISDIYAVGRYLDDAAPWSVGSVPSYFTTNFVHGSLQYASGRLTCPLLSEEAAFGTTTFANDPTLIPFAAVGGRLAVAELTPSYAGVAATLNDIDFVASGINHEIDGKFCTEASYGDRPVIVTNSAPAAVGGSLSDGVYSLVAIYVYRDANGNVIRSRVSDPYSVTLSGGTGTQYFTVTVGLYFLHNRIVRDLAAWSTLISPSTGEVQVYRTTANGSIYYLASVEPMYPIATSSTLAAALDVATVSDANIVANVSLYTTSGALENDPPPAFTSVVSNGTRLFGYPAGQDVVWFSKKSVPGEGINWSALLTQRLIPDGSTKTTLVALDGRVIALRENSIQWFDGDGPSDAGLGGAFSDTRIIPSSGGALPNSPACVTPMGVFFKSDDGIKLLTRGLEVNDDVGAPVAQYASLTLYSIAHVASEQRVYFVHESSEANPGILVYDYHAKLWSRYHWYSNDVAQAATVQPQAAVAYGALHVLNEDRLFKPGSNFRDHATYAYSLLAETPWVKLGHLQGFQRVGYISALGTIRSNHTLTLKIYKDYSETADETVTYSATGTAGTPLQVRHHWGKHCQSVKVRVYDASQSSSYEAVTLTSVALEVGGLPGVFRLPSTETV